MSTAPKPATSWSKVTALAPLRNVAPELMQQTEQAMMEFRQGLRAGMPLPEAEARHARLADLLQQAQARDLEERCVEVAPSIRAGEGVELAVPGPRHDLFPDA